SVRLPASWCGLSGLKTTIGRVSTYGILPLAPSLDTPGPLARSVEDAALLYSVMVGADALDPRTLSAPATGDPLAGLRRGGRGISALDYLAAIAERDALKRRFLGALDGIDALLTPTTQSAAIPVESVDQTTTPAHFTRLVNLLELCALSVPNGFTQTGLPLS